MKAYCIDTSGLSNPLVNMPEDIYATLWKTISGIVVAGRFAVTTEIYDELTHMPGDIGDCVRGNRAALRLEVGDAGWDGVTYLGHTSRMQVDYARVISENNGNRKGTVGINDLSIIALARTLGLPVVSMEALLPPNATWKRIPNICAYEGVEHLTFNDFLRREKIVL